MSGRQVCAPHPSLTDPQTAWDPAEESDTGYPELNLQQRPRSLVMTGDGMMDNWMNGRMVEGVISQP